MWIGIKDFPQYEVSNSGVIRNKRTGKTIKPYVGKRGYPVVPLWCEGKQYMKTVHRIVATAFIPNPQNKPEINHIDGNKLNFSLSNLEWCTAKENQFHARETGLHTSDGDKAIVQYDLNNRIVNRFKSASEASRVTGINRGNLSWVARGNTRAKTAGGYIWKYE